MVGVRARARVSIRWRAWGMAAISTIESDEISIRKRPSCSASLVLAWGDTGEIQGRCRGDTGEI